MHTTKEIENFVDNGFKSKRKGYGIKKRTLKIGIVAITLLVAATLVGATLISQFGKVETTMNVIQSITMDGNSYDEVINHNVEDAEAGCCYCFEHEVANNGCEVVTLDFEEWGNPDLIGIDVYYKQRCYLDELVIDVLDGIADDSFDVYVDGILVYHYDWSGDTTEIWKTHNIDLTSFKILCYGTHTVKINATGSPWSHFATYGQLGVNMIKLYCYPNVLCDSVDIGNPSSEDGHNLVSWGPVEPSANGGNWGGYGPSKPYTGDCRVVWDTIDGGSTFATVDLTCDFCECDCEKPDLELPFTLNPDETIEFCICYKLDILLKPGLYTIHHRLVPL